MHVHCPHCDNTIQRDDGSDPAAVVCSSCGSSVVHDPGATTAWLPREAPKRVGKFELLERLGIGSFGAVYRARDTELGRTVAIKIPRLGTVPEPEDLERFLREAKSAAQLKHPGIVSVYDASQRDGILFLVSEFISGTTLAERLTVRRFAFREAAELIAEVADALHYAHQRGVVHRDLKPSNIMIDLEGRPHLMDFGLAKWSLDDSTITVEGQILGTPAYMSPEQARGETRRVDARSDLYSLGVVLYQLLTNELPFHGQSRMMMVQVVQDEPRAPHLLHERVPRDLETICLKAMAKEPARRYQSGQLLADDLRRYLKGEPILARPVGRMEKAWRWYRRNPLLAAASTLAVVALFGVACVSAILASRENHHARDLSTALNRSEQHRLQAEYRLAESFLDRGLTLCEQGQVNRGLLWLTRGLQVVPPECTDLEQVIRINLDGWYHQLNPMRAAFRHPGTIAGQLVSPDARTILVVSADYKAQLWDAATGKAIGEAVAHAGPVVAAFSRSGRVAVTIERATGTGKVWDAISGRPIGLPLPAHGAVQAVVVTPDGKQVFTVDGDQVVRLWDATTTKCMGEFQRHQGPPATAIVSPDGSILLTTSQNTAQLWDVASQQRIGEPLQHDAAIETAAFSSDGQWVITGGWDKTARVWSTVTGKCCGPPLVHSQGVQTVALSPSGRTAVVGGGDRFARLWEVATGTPIGPPLEHRNRVESVAMSPDGQSALTGSTDATARLWNATTGKPQGPPLLHTNSVRKAAFSLDGTTLVTVTPDEELRIWSINTTQPMVVTLAEAGSLRTMAFRRDGQFALTGGGQLGHGSAQLWRTATGAKSSEPLPHSGEVRGVAWSPDGRTVATACSDNVARLWDVSKLEPIGLGFRHDAPVEAVAFSPDGQTILTGGEDDTARLWDVATGQPLGKPLLHDRSVLAVAFSPDGRTIVTATAGGIGQIWDPASGQPVGSSMTHQDWILAVAFSPDGKMIATASDDLTARIWDAITGKPLTPPLIHTDETEVVAFSPDGKCLLTGNVGGMAQLWDTATGKPLGPSFSHDGQVIGVAFGTDRQYCLTGSEDHKIRTWKRPAAREGRVESIAAQVQVDTGLELDAYSAVRVLTAEDWHARRARLAESGGLLQP